jgi:type VI secretion system protein ImpE
MMTAADLYREGKLSEAIQALNGELRNHPTDQKRRTFLFELLCFSGDYDRAEKHLDILGGAGPDSALGVMLYRAALAAERSRNDLFSTGNYPVTDAEPVPGGTLNGKPFETLEDADARIGPRVEVYAAGQYMWLPLAHIASIEMQPPKRLRDLLWIPALVRTGPKFQALELGEVLIPALSPFSFRHADDEVRLGRATVWEEQEGGAVIPFGQKILVVDGEDFPLLELRRLEIAGAGEAPQSHATAQ